ncbi:glucocorticoid-induced transcript 1 protein-like, partial [Ruditapes philippinarum]|uniref:glucocorticoid-induced transcript 1 protein-like n=1 Tax=Ruditapes philippinarum TaxID=129788 RepID=UPI00295BEB5F
FQDSINFNFSVERPKAIRVSPASSSLRRTSSLDTIGPYLQGKWPVDVGSHHHTQSSGTFMADKQTQTPEDWHVEVIENKAEKKKKKHRRSASFGHADKKLALNSIRQKLQKTKDQGTKQRSSPIPGNHNALLQTAPAVLMRSPAIGIHIPKTSIPRYQRNSVEGLNPEIEKMMQLNISAPEDEIERSIEIPDGHRAPVPEIRHSGTRSIDTQTPSGTLDDRSSGSPASPASRPHSISPAIPIMAGNLENSPRPSSNYDSSGSTPRDKYDKDTGDSESPDVCLKKTASPKPNKIVREPPDGCEIVKAFDEDRSGRPPSIKEPLLFCPIQGQGQFVLKPSISSAFCPLKNMYTQGTSFSQTTPTSIEGH